MSRNWKIRVDDILTCIEKINAYTAGMDFEQFREDDKTVDAVIRNFEIIGEAAGHIPLEIQEKYPELAWLEMRGMRNIMAHEYFGISRSITWRAIERDLPPLANGLQEMLKHER
jgi:uncharacterized protein with HEPN domain